MPGTLLAAASGTALGLYSRTVELARRPASRETIGDGRAQASRGSTASRSGRAPTRGRPIDRGQRAGHVLGRSPPQ